MRRLILSTLLILSASGALAQPRDCKTISDSIERLKCFDQPRDCKSIADTGERLKCFDAQPAGAATTPAPAPASAGAPVQAKCSASQRSDCMAEFRCVSGDARERAGCVATRNQCLAACGDTSPSGRRAACLPEASPCTSNGQCCNGACIKGLAEGRPGAWCGSDAEDRRSKAATDSCPKNFYKCNLNAGGRVDPKHPGCCWNLRTD